ncbi:6,7-dimethyl-8-ribityllumazine synthase [Butyriboletus roseoflavus]|nr:6,7-dimethyl-8-ribityllumazine synthase [Butyriboletus roseoflavus]
MSSIKGPSTGQHDGSSLRVAIVHARWNKVVIEALVAGAISKLRILVSRIPISWCSPFRAAMSYPLHVPIIAGSRVQAESTATDLLGFSLTGSSTPNNPSSAAELPKAPFDAVIAIGVLIKGSTMHFEYICDSVSHALMRVQLDTGIPVIFGVLTALNDDQALERAGIGRVNKGHNHGEDWGLAAVEMAVQCRGWSGGSFS